MAQPFWTVYADKPKCHITECPQSCGFSLTSVYLKTSAASAEEITLHGKNKIETIAD